MRETWKKMETTAEAGGGIPPPQGAAISRVRDFA